MNEFKIYKELKTKKKLLIDEQSDTAKFKCTKAARLPKGIWKVLFQEISTGKLNENYFCVNFSTMWTNTKKERRKKRKQEFVVKFYNTKGIALMKVRGSSGKFMAIQFLMQQFLLETEDARNTSLYLILLLFTSLLFDRKWNAILFYKPGP